ncbi:DsbE family thiol:disulfide interchange protein [Isoalcanivorax beigongshangi]|uniref:DsbE family thiol:disulfide interchange protein n=1 Tax=Isoalcanivorax beigongshangi TaxID=3238810 RepID=A0ABV4AG24_9GAMM
MKKSLWGVIPLLIFVALVVMLYRGLGRDTETLPSALVGQPVPAFSLPSLIDDQRQLDPALLKGEWTLLNVWATWCPTCYVEHPYLVDVAQQGVRIIGVNYKDKRDKALQYLADLGNPYREVIVDQRGDFAMDLGVYGAPETFLINPQGRIVLRFAGEFNQSVWQERFLPLIEAGEGAP